MEEQIIIRLRNRDEEALEWMIEQYGSMVYFVIHRIIGPITSKEDIEELSSEVFVWLWNEIEQYDGSKGTLKTFLLMKTKYMALDFKRQQEKKNIKLKRTDEIEIETLASSESMEIQLSKRELLQQLYFFIEELKEPDRSYFIMRYYWQYEVKQIALHFKTSVKSVESSLYRIRKQLKTLKEKEGLEWMN